MQFRGRTSDTPLLAAGFVHCGCPRHSQKRGSECAARMAKNLGGHETPARFFKKTGAGTASGNYL